MSVETCWRRIPEGAISGLDPRQLRGLAPGGSGGESPVLTRSGRLLVVEDGAALIGELLQLGAAEGPSSSVAKWLAAGPPDWDDRHLVGVFRPEFVRQAAEFLAAAPIDEWSDRFRPDLAAFAGSLDPARCYDDGRHTALRRHAAALAELFGRAAEDGEAVIEKLSA